MVIWVEISLRILSISIISVSPVFTGGAGMCFGGAACGVGAAFAGVPI